MCKFGGHVTKRHDAIRDFLHSLCQSALLAPSKEVRVGGANLVPADILLPRYYRGRPAALDITVVHPLQPRLTPSASRTAGAALVFAENKKKVKYEEVCRAARVHFIPLAVEFFGGWGAPAAEFLSRLAGSLTRLGEPDPAPILQRIYQRLSSLMVKHNAAAVFARCGWLEI